MRVHLFLSQEEYVAEGLQWSFVKYQDNQGCLDLIEGCPVGVFALLNEVLSQHFVLLFLIIKKNGKINNLLSKVHFSMQNQCAPRRVV